MRISIFTICALAAYLPSVGMAAPVGMPEPQAMVYYQIPLGARKSQSGHRFGFRVDEMFLNSNQPGDFSRLMTRPAVLEFQAGYGGLQKLSVGGFDYMEKFRASRQNDEGGDASSGSNGAEATDGGSSGTSDQGQTTAGNEDDESKLTIQKILDNAEPGWLIGGAIGILILSGVAD